MNYPLNQLLFGEFEEDFIKHTEFFIGYSIHMHNRPYVELLNPFAILIYSQNISIIIICIFVLDLELLSHVLFVVFGIVFPRIYWLPCFLQLFCCLCWDSSIEDILALELSLELKCLLRDQLLKLNLFFGDGLCCAVKELTFLRA